MVSRTTFTLPNQPCCKAASTHYSAEAHLYSLMNVEKNNDKRLIYELIIFAVSPLRSLGALTFAPQNLFLLSLGAVDQ
jgi:hypothetical protein